MGRRFATQDKAHASVASQGLIWLNGAIKAGRGT